MAFAWGATLMLQFLRWFARLPGDRARSKSRIEQVRPKMRPLVLIILIVHALPSVMFALLAICVLADPNK
jgi:hypothetical protein